MKRSSRRQFIKIGAAATAAALTFRSSPTRAADASQKRLRVGMCDWMLQKQNNPAVFDLAREIGLDGVQVSVGDTQTLYMRDAALRQKYLDASRRTGVAIAASGMGQLNQVPFMSEPKTAIWTADTIDITQSLGAQVILVAFFPPNGELKAENKEDMRRTTDTLVELAPHAEKAGVILGLESYLTAEANLSIIEKVKSPAVQVYYDVYNSWVSRGHDPVKEIKLLGQKLVCQVHLKEGPHHLGETGKIDWPAIAGALKDIDYKGWLILETSHPSGDLVKDTRINLDYVRKTFATLA